MAIDLDAALRIKAQVEGAGQVQAFGKSLKGLSGASKLSQADFQRLRREIDQLSRKTGNTTAGMRAQVAALTQLRERVSVSSASYVKLGLEIDQVRGKLRRLDSASRSSASALQGSIGSASIGAASEEASISGGSFFGLSRQAEELRSIRTKLEQSSEFSKRINELDLERSQILEQIETRQGRIADNAAKIGDIEEQITANQGAQKFNQNQIERSQQALTENKDRLAQVQAKINQLQAKGGDLTAAEGKTLRTLNTERDKLQKKIEGNNKSIREGKERLRSVVDAGKALGTTLRNTNTSTRGLNDSITRFNGQLDQSVAKAKQLGAELDQKAGRSLRQLNRQRLPQAALAGAALSGVPGQEFIQAGFAGGLVAGPQGAAVGAGTAAGLRLFGATSGVASDFEAELKRAAAIEGLGKNYDQLRESISAVARVAAGTPTEVAQLATALSRAGFSADETEASLRSIVFAAEAVALPFEEVGSIASTTLRSFGLSAGQTNEVLDVLVNTANSSNQSLTDVGEALKFAAPNARQFGVSVADLSATLAVLADNGIRGSEAGTGLRTGLNRLVIAATGANDELLGVSRGSEILAKAMRTLGAEVVDANGQLLPMDEVLKNLKTNLGQFSTGQQAEIAKALFGDEAGSKFLALLNTSDAKIDQVFKTLRNSTGAVDETHESMDSFSRSVARLQGNLASVGIEIGEKFNLVLKPLADLLSDAIGAAQGLPKPLRDIGTAALAAGIAIGGLVLAAKGIAILAGATKALTGLAGAASLAAGVKGIGGLTAAIALIPGWGWAIAGGIAVAGLAGAFINARQEAELLADPLKQLELSTGDLKGRVDSATAALRLAEDRLDRYERSTNATEKTTKRLKEEVARLRGELQLLEGTYNVKILVDGLGTTDQAKAALSQIEGQIASQQKTLQALEATRENKAAQAKSTTRSGLLGALPDVASIASIAEAESGLEALERTRAGLVARIKRDSEAASKGNNNGNGNFKGGGGTDDLEAAQKRYEQSLKSSGEAVLQLNRQIQDAELATAGLGLNGSEALRHAFEVGGVQASRRVEDLQRRISDLRSRMAEFSAQGVDTTQMQEQIDLLTAGVQRFQQASSQQNFAQYVESIRAGLPSLSEYQARLQELTLIRENEKLGIDGLTESQKLDLSLKQLSEEQIARLNELYPELIQKLRDAANAIDDANKKQEKSFGKQFSDKIKEAYQESKKLGEALGNEAVSAIDNLSGKLTEFAETGKLRIKDFVKEVLRGITKILIKAAILQAIGFAFNLDGKSSTETRVPKKNANGNAFTANRIVPFAKGGVFDQPTFFKFRNGGRLKDGVLGEAGPEAILPLKRGADGKLGVVAGSGGGSRNTSIQFGDMTVNIQERPDGLTAEDIGSIVQASVAEKLQEESREGGLIG